MSRGGGVGISVVWTHGEPLAARREINFGTRSTKRCPRCREVLTIESFRRNRTMPDGHSGLCRQCDSASVRAWRARNPEHGAAYNARRRLASREIHCARCGAAFTALRRDRLYCTTRCRLALHRGGLRAVLPQLIAIYGATCWICTKRIDVALRWPHPLYATVDHVRARSRGGTHEIENLRPAHMLCNARRGARPVVAAS